MTGYSDKIDLQLEGGGVPGMRGSQYQFWKIPVLVSNNCGNTNSVIYQLWYPIQFWKMPLLVSKSGPCQYKLTSNFLGGYAILHAGGIKTDHQDVSNLA